MRAYVLTVVMTSGKVRVMPIHYKRRGVDPKQKQYKEYLYINRHKEDYYLAYTVCTCVAR